MQTYDVIRNQVIQYWQKRLSGIKTYIDFPIDFTRSNKAPKIGKYKFSLSSKAAESIKIISSQLSASEEAILLAVFNLLLFRYCNQIDIVIDVVIEPTKKNIPSRNILDPQQPFSEFLLKINKNLLNDIAMAHISCDKILSLVREDQDDQFDKQLQFKFVIHDSKKNALSNLENHSNLYIDNEIIFSLDLKTNIVSGNIEYNANLFTLETIKSFVFHYKTLLNNIIESPSDKLIKLAILSKHELHKIIYEWNNTKVDYPDNLCLHKMFEDQVKKTPNAIAVIFENTMISYADLNQRANQLANLLRQKGIICEDRVGIFVERSELEIICILAILKSGGAYVPLDPAYPEERTNYIIQDSQIKILLTHDKFKSILKNGNYEIICLDNNKNLTSNTSFFDDQSVQMNLNNLAYIIYTSGSTGKPKGVMIEHGGVCNAINWGKSFRPVNDQDRFLHAASINSDASVWEIFGALLSGAAVVIASLDQIKDITLLIRFIINNHLTIIGVTPAILKAILFHPEIKKISTLHTVVCAAESMAVEIPTIFYKQLPMVQLYNAYGPTETTMAVTFSLCKANIVTRTVPIGTPIANTQIYILDDYLNPVPVGVQGTIYISGICLARGYNNRPDLTEKLFIPNPFSKISDSYSLMYNSGDIGRYLASGDIEILGRTDWQVKIRGFRIELEEVETQIRKIPGIIEAVVAAKEDKQGKKRLVAYVIVSPQHVISVKALKEKLAVTLPEYMIPSAFINVTQFPLTPNMKIDRNALPSPTHDQLSLGTVYVPPQNDIESFLISVWQDALKVKKIGVNDNFFDLGGDSLSAIQVVSDIQTQLEIEFYNRLIIENPTIAELAKTIMKSANFSNIENKIKHYFYEKGNKITLSKNKVILFNHANNFVNASQRMLLQTGLRLQVTTVLAIDGKLDPLVLEKAILFLLNKHEILRIQINKNKVPYIRSMQDSEQYKLPIIDVSNDQNINEKIRENIKINAASVFEYDNSLFKIELYSITHSKFLLHITMNHFIADAHSMLIFIRDLFTVYEDFKFGYKLDYTSVNTLMSNPYQVRIDFEENTPDFISFWKKYLASVSNPLLCLPSDSHLKRTIAYSPSSLTVNFATDIKSFCTENDCSDFALLFTVYSLCLHVFSRQNKLSIMIPVLGRTQSQMDVMGFFAYSIECQIDFHGVTKFKELLIRTNNALKMTSAKRFPLSKVILECFPDLYKQRSEHGYVQFNIINTSDEVKLNDIIIKPTDELFMLLPFEELCDFSLQLEKVNKDITIIRLVYNSCCINNNTAKEFINYFQKTLNSIIKQGLEMAISTDKHLD